MVIKYLQTFRYTPKNLSSMISFKVARLGRDPSGSTFSGRDPKISKPTSALAALTLPSKSELGLEPAADG